MSTGSAAPVAPGTVLEWRTWPLRDRPRAGALAIGVVLITAMAATTLGGHVGFGILAVVVLSGSLNPFFSPTDFRLDRDGVTVRRWPTRKERPWADLHSCVIDRHGITLSPFEGRAWLEPYRGVRLLFDDNRDEVAAFVRDHLDDEVRIRGLLPTDATRPRAPGAGSAGAAPTEGEEAVPGGDDR